MGHRTCEVDGCTAPRIAKGMCTKHYQRWKKRGTTDDPVRLDPEERRRRYLESVRRYRERNRERLNDKRRAYREAHLEHERARCRAYHARHPGRNAENTRRWRELNPDRGAAQNRAWYAANRAWSAEKSARRRAIMRATATERVDLRAILARHGMVCHLCRDRIAHRRDLHFDHVVPLARGGTHTPGNIRPAHAYCNRSKGARPVRTVRRPARVLLEAA